MCFFLLFLLLDDEKDPYFWLIDPDAYPGGPKTYGTYGSGSGYATLDTGHSGSMVPPLLVQRCDAVLLPGWVIWKKCDFVHENFPPGRLTIVSAHCRSSLGRMAQFLCRLFNPNPFHVNAALKQTSLQTTSRKHHHTPPKQNYCTVCKKCTRLNSKLWNKK